MKFKLVENIHCNHEQLLTEKHWVKVQDKKKITEPFYFYCSDKKSEQNDVNTLIPVIMNTQKGTYKQQLDRKIVNELKDIYQKNYLPISVPFELEVVSSEVSDEELGAASRIITLTDRQLRKKAENDVIIQTGFKTNEWMIHHKNSREHDNDLSNIILISRKAGDEYAHACHKLIQSSKNSLTNTTRITVPLLEHDGKRWRKTHTVYIVLK